MFYLVHILLIILGVFGGTFSGSAEVLLIQFISENFSDNNLMAYAVIQKVLSIIVFFGLITLGHYWFSSKLTIWRLKILQEAIFEFNTSDESGLMAKEFLVDTERISNQFYFQTIEISFSLGVIIAFFPLLIENFPIKPFIQGELLLGVLACGLLLVAFLVFIVGVLARMSNKSNEALNIFPDMMRAFVSYMWSFGLSYTEFASRLLQVVKPRILLAQISYGANNMPRLIVEALIMIFFYFNFESTSILIASFVSIRILPHILGIFRFLLNCAGIWYSVRKVYFGNSI